MLAPRGGVLAGVGCRDVLVQEGGIFYKGVESVACAGSQVLPELRFQQFDGRPNRCLLINGALEGGHSGPHRCLVSCKDGASVVVLLLLSEERCADNGLRGGAVEVPDEGLPEGGPA